MKQNEQESDLIQQYATDIEAAYDQLLVELAYIFLELEFKGDLSFLENSKIKLEPYKCVNPDNPSLKKGAQIIGSCGGRCAGASKRLQSAIVVKYLKGLDQHIDMTGEVANKIATMILNRGISRGLRAEFATTGRTASQKSQALILNKNEIDCFVESTRLRISEIKTIMLEHRKSNALKFELRWKKLRSELIPQ